MNIGENIKARRIELEISQRQLAEMMGYSNHSTIARIEAGSVDIPQSKIVQFANVLKTTPTALMGWLKTDPTEQAIFEARLLKDEETMNMVKQYLTLDEKNKRAIRQMVETLSAE